MIEAAWMEFWGPNWGQATGAMLLYVVNVAIVIGVVALLGSAVHRSMEGPRG